jgi:hypothetical protein
MINCQINKYVSNDITRSKFRENTDFFSKDRLSPRRQKVAKN